MCVYVCVCVCVCVCVHTYIYIASAKEAQSALIQLQGVEVDGHKLLLKMSSRTSAEDSGDGHVVPATAGKGAKKSTGVGGAVLDDQKSSM